MFLSRLVPRTATLARVSFAKSKNIQRAWVPRAFYAAGGGGLTRDVITSRILETLKGYEKIDPAKVYAFTPSILVSIDAFLSQLTPSASFTKDLGLDSLDSVEVVMAIEEVRSLCSNTSFLCVHIFSGVFH